MSLASTGFAAAASAAPRADHVRVPKERQICCEGEPASALYEVKLGCVRLEVSAEDGERDVIGFLFEGETLLCGLETCWASAFAVVDTVLVRRDLAGAALIPDALAGSDRLLARVVRRMRLLHHMTASARMMWFFDWLRERTGRTGPTVEIPMGRRDIADFLGLTPETVSRSLSRLQAQGRLRRRGPNTIDMAPRRRPPDGV